MKDLGRNATALLDAARRADSAPANNFSRGRERLMATLAAGAITGSALGAKGASLGMASAAAGATPVVGTASSLLTTLVSAVTIGLGAGLIALSPATNTRESSRLERPIERRLDAGETAAKLVSVRTANSQPTSSTPRSAALPEIPAIVDVVPAQTIPAAVATPTQARVGEGAPTQADPVVATPAPARLGEIAPPRAGRVEAESLQATPGEGAPTQAGRAEAAAVPTTSDSSTVNAPIRASIAEETALLADVQRALKSGHAKRALEALDRYHERCPRGHLQEEATVSRVLALCALDRTEEARQLAGEFQRRYPSSPLLPRVSAACRFANVRSAGERSPVN